MRAQAPDHNRRGTPRHLGNLPWTKMGRGSSQITLDPYPAMISRKNTTECDVTLWPVPRRRIDRQKKTTDHQRWSEPTKLASKRKWELHAKWRARPAKLVTPDRKWSPRVLSLGHIFCSTFVAPIVGYRVIKSERLAIGITVVIFNSSSL